MLSQSLLMLLSVAALATKPAPGVSSGASASPHAPAKPAGPALSRRELVAKVLSQGVPAHGFNRILDFIDKNTGKDFVQDTYQCTNFPPESPRTCDEKLRAPTSQKITLREQNYVVLVDFAMPSTAKRFFLINMKTGAVESFLAAHGRGSGINAVAWKFSNKKDSKQTSLGMYLTGGTYVGHYGLILRMYGLEKSNDQAYNRDIVLHGATYAGESFIKMIDPTTKEPYGRLGVSWGCPAVAVSVAKRIIPLLKGGALIYHDHKELADEALNGKEVVGQAPPMPPPKPQPVPLPPPRPKDLPSKDESAQTPAAPVEPNKKDEPALPLEEPVAPATMRLGLENDVEGEFDPATSPADDSVDASL